LTLALHIVQIQYSYVCLKIQPVLSLERTILENCSYNHLASRHLVTMVGSVKLEAATEKASLLVEPNAVVLWHQIIDNDTLKGLV